MSVGDRLLSVRSGNESNVTSAGSAMGVCVKTIQDVTLNNRGLLKLRFFADWLQIV